MPKRVLLATILLLLTFYLVACGPNQAVLDLESRNTDLVQRVGQLQVELEETRHEASVMESEREGRMKALVDENQQAKEQTGRLGHQLAEIEVEAKAITNERDALQRELAASQRASERVMNEEIVTLEAKVVEVTDRQMALEVELSLTKGLLAETELGREGLLNEASSLRVELARARINHPNNLGSKIQQSTQNGAAPTNRANARTKELLAQSQEDAANFGTRAAAVEAALEFAMSAFQTEVSRLERFFSEEGETGDGQQENPIRFGNLEGIKGQFDEAMLGLNVLAEERDAFSLQAEMATRAALEAVDQVAAVEESLLKATDDRDTHLFQLNQLENRNESLTERLERTAYELDVAEKLASDLTSQYATLLQETAELDEIGDAQQSQLRTTRNSLEQAQNEVARLTGARGIYTVQPADSLSSIARFFYRNGNRWSDIAMANRFLIGGNPDLIYPGMVLVVPH